MRDGAVNLSCLRMKILILFITENMDKKHNKSGQFWPDAGHLHGSQPISEIMDHLTKSLIFVIFIMVYKPPA